MSRWKSPQVAAVRSERVARNVERQRKRRRRDWMLVFGIAVASMGLMVADYFWLWHEAKERHERRHQQRSRLTNDPASQAPNVGQNQVTNHD